MGIRTNQDAVIAILGDDYGKRVDGTFPNMTPYIQTASNIVDQAIPIAAGNGFSLSSATWELVERWLSAHVYTKSDPLYTSKSTGGASGSFVSGTEPERYKDMAIVLDTSGTINSLLKRQVARGFHIGCPASTSSWGLLN